MLVLTRRVGEEIVIGGDIRITVTAIIGSKVRIGVTAPDFVRVDREEIHALRSRRIPARRPLAHSSAG
jgi:carbon storage regulator